MADSTSLARLCDGVLVVVREGVTRKKILSKAVASIEKSKLVGMVFNQASTLTVDYEHYYGGYYSADNPKQSKKEAKKQAKQAKKEAEQVKAASA
jgi:Mrp family chromosome partitioning ATPase